MTPRADFVCFRCEEKEAGSGGPFRDLPIAKPKCPNCGARRWMQRQWSGYSPMVSTNGAMQRFNEADRRAEPIMLAHQEKHDAALRADIHARQAESVVPGLNMRVRAVPPAALAGAVAPYGAHVSLPAGGAHPGATVNPILMNTAAGAGKILQYGARNAIPDPRPGEVPA